MKTTSNGLKERLRSSQCLVCSDHLFGLLQFLNWAHHRFKGSDGVHQFLLADRQHLQRLGQRVIGLADLALVCVVCLELVELGLKLVGLLLVGVVLFLAAGHDARFDLDLLEGGFCLA